MTSLLKAKWKTLHREPVDNIIDTVAEIILESDTDREVHIGTDAQKHGKYTDFVTAIVILDPGKGGRAFYAKTRFDFMKSLQQKLFQEVQLSLEIALELCKIVDSEDISIHVDANTNLKWGSGPFHQNLAGMVAGNGFKSILKPDAWCASHVADHAVKNKNNVGWKKKRKRKRAA